jgi:hypothetical protein
LIRKLDGKRPLRRSRSRCKDDVRLGIKEIGWEDVDWIHLTANRDQWRAVVNTVMNLVFHIKQGIS